MEYILSFLEGIITFISPCLLPMLPIYLSYFAGGQLNNNRKKALQNAIGFVLGFTVVFVTLGAFAGSIGQFLKNHHTAVNIVGGVIIILFGLNFMELLKIPFLSTSKRIQLKNIKTGFFSTLLFGIIFAIGWTPCVGAFLGSALMLAASSANSFKGIFMLISFSMGLGIPFIASALFIEYLKSAFEFIKKHYRMINLISGGLLVVVGILMATGYMNYFLSLFTL